YYNSFVYSTSNRRPQKSTLFPYTTLFRSDPDREREPLLHVTAEREVVQPRVHGAPRDPGRLVDLGRCAEADRDDVLVEQLLDSRDRKSTRLNSSHGSISYAVFCLKKKNQ